MIQIAIIIITIIIFILVLIKAPKSSPKPVQQADEYNYQVQRYNDVIRMIMDNWGDGSAPGWPKVIQDIKKEADHTKEKNRVQCSRRDNSCVSIGVCRIH